MKIKTYTITLEEGIEHNRVTRTCDGFSSYELLGLITQVQQEIIQQIRGELKPNIVERNFIKQENDKI